MGPQQGRPSNRPSQGAKRVVHEPPTDSRDRLAFGLLVFVAIAAVFGNLVAGLLAPGWTGVGTDAQVQDWRKWANITSVAAATLGISALGCFAFIVAMDLRSALSLRLVSTFGTGLVVSLLALAIGHPLEPTQLIVLSAGAFAVTVAGTIEALAPPKVRVLGLVLGLVGSAALLRMGAFAVGHFATRPGQGNVMMVAQLLSSAGLGCELLAQSVVLMYLILRPGLRGTLLALTLVGLSFFTAIWALWSTLSSSGGTLRDALQRSLSTRVQEDGPLPTWVLAEATQQEIALLDRSARIALLPSVFAELSSLGIAIAAMGTATRANAPLLAALTLAILSRGQVDTPIRAMELALAALAGIVLCRRVPADEL